MTKKRETQKAFKKTIQDIKLLISLAKASTKITSISIRERDGIYQLRPQIHLILRSNTGNLKTTMLNFIKKASKAIQVDSTTIPGMIGTIHSGTMQVVPGASWEGKNNIILFDEFKFRRKSDDFIVFLKLLEDQIYTKRFGLFSFKQHLKDKDLYFTADKGKITVKTRFSAVIATMKRFEYHRGSNFKALVNRTIPYEFVFSLEELDYLLSRTKLFSLTRFPVQSKYNVNQRTYMSLKRQVKKLLKDNNVGRENFARAVGDVIRVYCIVGGCKKKVIADIVKWKTDAYAKIGRYYKKE